LRHAVRVCVYAVIPTLVLLSACRRAEEPLAPEVRPVRVMTITMRTGGDTVTLTGRVQAEAEINAAFRIDGRLIARTVEVGDRVKPGQLLARLDAMNEESSLQSARAQLAAAQAQGVEARSNFIRMRDLLKENAISRASFEQSEALFKITQSQIESSQSVVSIAQNRVSYTRLVSDVAGVVTARGPEPGEVVGAGRMIVQIARDGAVDAVFDVPAQVKDSAPRHPQIEVALTSDPNVRAAGKVREVSPRADPVTGTFQVRVRLIDPPSAMRLGSIVTGRMTLESTAAIDIPASALIRPAGQAAVWIINKKAGTVEARHVEVTAYAADRVQVSQGLTGGDVIVVAGAQALRPGQKVRWPEVGK
jgi:RND family efflux transporter MFP subunit